MYSFPQSGACVPSVKNSGVCWRRRATAVLGSICSANKFVRSSNALVIPNSVRVIKSDMSSRQAQIQQVTAGTTRCISFSALILMAGDWEQTRLRNGNSVVLEKSSALILTIIRSLLLVCQLNPPHCFYISVLFSDFMLHVLRIFCLSCKEKATTLLTSRFQRKLTAWLWMIIYL